MHIVKTARIIGFSISFLFASTLIAKEYRIAVEGTFPPFSMVDNSGKLTGFDVDIANALCTQMKAKCTIHSQDWDAMIPSLISKKFDFLVASMTVTDERKEVVAFTNPYYLDNIAIFSLKKNNKPNLEDVKNLKQVKVGVQKSTISEQFARQKFKDANIIPYDQVPQMAMDIKANRLDYVVIENLTLIGGALFSKEELGSIHIQDKKYTQGEHKGATAITLRKQDTQLVSDLNKALDDIIKSGVYAKISMKYFSVDLSKDLKKAN